MLDTIKVGIPLTAQQHKRISAQVKDANRYQWILFNQTTGEMLFKRVRGLAYTDQHSYHRELCWDMDATYEPSCKLTVEFSIPKFWYGHNIYLLYDFMAALNELRKNLDRQFKFGKKLALPLPEFWSVLRLDICYAWNLRDQQTAQHYLNSLKHLSYPKKKPTIYETSIVFPGGTFSLKFYLKEPEFKAHDRKELLKAKAALEWIEWLENTATGVLRCEATLKAKYLKRQQIYTVADLLKPVLYIEWDDSLLAHNDFNHAIAMSAIMASYAQSKGCSLIEAEVSLVETPLKNGMRFEAPEGDFVLEADGKIVESFYHPGGGFTVKEESKLETKIQGFITRFVGDNTKIQSADEVKLKLLQHYKPVKASRLVSFWLYVQRFGEADAKETFGKDSFYDARRDLKKAGISLLDEQKLANSVDKNFLREFELIVPSKHCINKHDDFRDSHNILNYIPRTSGNPY